jgi:hypothetical protein
MALLFIDGFDAGDTVQKWSSVVSGTSDTASRFSSGRSFRVPYGSYSPIKIFPAQINTVFVGFAFTASGAGAQSPFFHIWGDSGNTLHLTVSLHNGTQFQLRRGGWNDTLLATGVYSVTGWVYVEISASIHDTTGSVTVKVNGTTVITFSGDTKNGGTNNTIDAISGGLVYSSVTYNYYDDLYVCDETGSAPYNTFLGDVRVHTMSPSAAGTTTQFTPSSGANYTTVDELPYSATDYVAASSPTIKDTYQMSDLPAGAATIFGVQTNVIAKKTDAGNIAIKPVVRSGGTDYSGSSTVLSSSDITISNLRTQDPATATTWTAGGVNGMEAGVEIA